jgi:hypothetical protein
MNIQEIIDFIDRHTDNYNDVYMVRNDDHEDISRVTGIARDGLMYKYCSYYLEIVEWSDLKKDYHLQSKFYSEEKDEDELIETLELNELKIN